MPYDLESLIEVLILRIATSGFEGCTVTDLIETINSLTPSSPSGSPAGLIFHWLLSLPTVTLQPPPNHPTTSLATLLALPEASRPRLFVVEEIMWKAIAGHAPDLKRVPKFEWEALVGIASTREEGIIQGDLCRLTGQDKRSLPKRTDALAKKRYIEKRATLVRGTKTSKLWLHRYAPPLLQEQNTIPESTDGDTEYHLPGAIETDNLDGVPWAAAWTGEAIDYLLFGKTIVATVKEFGVLRYDDLRSKLGIQHQRWQMRVMARSCRFFVKVGALRFVAASMNNRVYRDCLKFVEDPSIESWSVFLSSSAKKVKKTRKQQIKEEESRPVGERKNRESNVVSPYRWNPDVPFQDVLLEAMLRAGETGVTNTELTSRLLAPSFGRFVANASAGVARGGMESERGLLHLAVRVELTRNGKTTTYRYRPQNAAKEETEEPVEEPAVTPEDLAADPGLKYGFRVFTGPIITEEKGKGKKRGRGKSGKTKEKVVILDQGGEQEVVEVLKKPRGRPRKVVPVEDEVSTSVPRMTASEAPVANSTVSLLLKDSADVNAMDPSAVPDTTSSPSETPRETPGKKFCGRKPDKKADSDVLYTCPTCDGTWKNDLGLKYHQTKSRTRCNPNWEDKPITPKKVSYISKTGDSAKIDMRRSRLLSVRRAADEENKESGDGAPRKTTKLRGGLVLEKDKETDSVRAPRVAGASGFRSLRPGETFEVSSVSGNVTLGSLAPSTPLLGGSVGKKAGRKSLGRGRDTPSVPGTPSRPNVLIMLQNSGARTPVVGLVTQTPVTQMPVVGSMAPPETPRRAESVYPVNILDTSRPSTRNGWTADPPSTPSTRPSTLAPQIHIPMTTTVNYTASPIEITQFTMPPIKNIDTLPPEAIQLRRTKELIRYLVRVNGGAFPAKVGMWQAICQLWPKHFSDPPPPYEISLKAAKECSRVRGGNGEQIVEITYGFKDSQGSNARCHILVEGRLDKQATVVERLKNEIKKVYPTIYIPPAFAPRVLPDGSVTLVATPLTRRKRALGGEVMVLDAPLYRRQVEEKRKVKEEGTGVLGRKRRRVFGWRDLGGGGKRARMAIEEDEGVWGNAEAVEFLGKDEVVAFVSVNEGLGDEEEGLEVEEVEEDETNEEDFEEIDGDNKSIDDAIDPRLFEGFDIEVQTSAPSTTPVVRGPSPEPEFKVEFAPITSIAPTVSSEWLLLPLSYFLESPSFTLSHPLSETLWQRALPYAMLPQSPNDPSGSSVPPIITAPPLSNLEAIQTYRILSRYPNISLRSKAPPKVKTMVLEKPTRTVLPGVNVAKTKKQGRPATGQTRLGDLSVKNKISGVMTERAMSELPADADAEKEAHKSLPHPYRGTLDDALLAAFVSIRVLAGGTDKNIDWAIIMNLFPNLSLITLRKFWIRTLKDHSAILRSLTERFQTAFIKAYKNDVLPKINFDDLFSYDWSAVINWTVSLHKEDRVPLPKTRKAFEHEFELGGRVEDDGWREAYWGVGTSIFGRYEAITRCAGAILLDGPREVIPATPGWDPTHTSYPTSQQIARSWLRSLAWTPGTKGTPDAIIQKFLTLSPARNTNQVSGLLESAVTSLTRDHVISRGKVRGQTDRIWRLNKQFRGQLEKASRLPLFKEANTFLKVLDRTFAKASHSNSNADTPTFQVPFLMPDGAVMALINLTTHNHLSLFPPDPPDIPRGFHPGNYESRKMSKALLLFSLHATPTSSFTNPLALPILHRARTTPIPTMGPDGLLYFWTDFFGEVNMEMWRRVLGAVCFGVAVRGRMSRGRVKMDLRGLVDGGDVEAVVKWALDVGVLVMREDDRLGVSEWWWVVIGDGLGESEEAEEEFEAGVVMLNTARV